MKRFTLTRTVICLVLATLGGGAVAQDHANIEASSSLVQGLRSSLEYAEKVLDRGEFADGELESMRQQVDFVADSALRLRQRAQQRAADKERLLAAMGPAPAESDLPESEQVAASRQELEELVAEYQGLAKSANVILARVEAIRDRVTRAELDFLARVLGERTDPPLAPGPIAAAVERVPAQLDRFSDRLNEWWQGVEFDRDRFETLMWWLVLLVFVVIVIIPTRNWLLRRYGPDHQEANPPFVRRFRVMFAVGFSNVVLPVVSIVGLYVVLLKSAGMTADLHEMTLVVVVTLCQYFVITGLSAAAMSPGYPNWRISDFTDESAEKLYRSIRLFAIVVVVVNLVRIPLTELRGRREMVEILVMDVSMDPLHAILGTAALIAIAASMLNILRKSNWCFAQVRESGQVGTCPPGRIVRVFFAVAKLGLIISIGAALFGYVNLGIYLSQRIVRSLLLVAFAYLLRTFVSTTCNQIVREDSGIGKVLRTRLDYDDSGASRLMFWLMLLVDLVVSVGAIIVLLLIWGVHTTDVQTTITKLLYGVNVGGFTLSLIDIGVALGLFVFLFVCVRLLQGFLSKRVLPQTVHDVGVRDALTTGIGYTGIIIAAVIAVSSLGLELSQLAIIFGALSVGIGFGLQHVVNNFVSGLILLMHRPIKAGDWIVVGQHEGYVKKINVVATELQTFDNAEVIVPNSQLVSSEVLNWTHKSTVARVIVSVHVSYGSDPEWVREVLLRCADARKDVLRSPAPVVMFQEFGDSAMRFELRFFIREADYMVPTASDLRFAIAAAFREAGIVIPFPQRDIHIMEPNAITDTASTSVQRGSGRGGQSPYPPGRHQQDDPLGDADGDG